MNDGLQVLYIEDDELVRRASVQSLQLAGFDVIGTTLSVAAGSGVLSNDSDLDGDTLSVTAVNGVAGNVGASVVGTYGRLTLSQFRVGENGAEDRRPGVVT